MRVRTLAFGALSLLSLTTAGLLAAMPSQLEEWKAAYRRPGVVPQPADNRSNAERTELGKKLFFDPGLSGSGQLSCASCHDPKRCWSDGLPLGHGHKGQILGRRTPTLLDLAWGEQFFWDGRASSLEEQALMPIFNPAEMAQTPAGLFEYVSKAYAPMIKIAYPGEPVDNQTVGKALACFERTILSPPSAFDRWIEGEPEAISNDARQGFILFNSKAKCSTCHSGWRLTDDAFYDIGARGKDLGRGKLYPGVDSVEYAFKTPTLRDVARRAPYLHDGSEKTLADVLSLYVRGGRIKRRSLSDQITPLELSAREQTQLLDFLYTLNSDQPQGPPEKK